MTDIRLSESGRLVKSDNIDKIEEGLRESKTGNVMTIEETTTNQSFLRASDAVARIMAAMADMKMTYVVMSCISE